MEVEGGGRREGEGGGSGDGREGKGGERVGMEGKGGERGRSGVGWRRREDERRGREWEGSGLARRDGLKEHSVYLSTPPGTSSGSWVEILEWWRGVNLTPSRPHQTANSTSTSRPSMNGTLRSEVIQRLEVIIGKLLY